MEGKYDSALLGILQHEGKIDRFLHAVMAFLYRRTDYYRIMKSKEDRLGFPPGVALKMLNTIFKEYEEKAAKDEELRQKSRKTQESLKSNKEASSASGVNSETVPKQDGSLKSENSINNTSHTVKKEETKTGNNSAEQTNKNTETKCDTIQTVETKEEKITTTSKEKDEKDDDTELTRQQKAFQNDPESYNGAIRDHYKWAQTITDLDLRVMVPAYIRKGKDVKVDIGKKHTKVQYKDETGEWIVVIDSDLTWDVRKDECMWTLTPGKNVLINFEKREERWWDAVLVTEPKISVRKIDASRPITDLDEEAQAKIEEMMYNDRQKKMGKPTSKEQKMQDILKNAWDAEGSPFKGQPFDPSKFSMDENGMINMKPT